ncbi:MAG: bifunctional DNA-formamidopyrimidine glycosylase/DNA-(apurinic or apyrimidinic site) lyase [Syntrophomonadaceae bacterium]|nr:bifunctional DNA-formamidopyrimidine glycosylase/DNA-(apurinic or apyrimidinic site) lyase [Syntrophomonadaceae bacterium]
MPELPEIETIVRSLQPLIGQRIEQLDVINNVVIKQQDYLPGELRGQTIRRISRRGKFIIIDVGRTRFIVIHLGMSGRFYLDDAANSRPKHTHVVMVLQEGQELRYFDPRRFGGVWLIFDSNEVVRRLGPEPLGPDLTQDYLASVCQNRRVAVKTLILNQGVIAGIGNIYADEILHRAGIRPDRPAGSLRPEEVELLRQAMAEILKLGIANRGTTFRDYRDGLNLPGEFQSMLKVYGRFGQSCLTCGEPICRDIIGGRSSHFCPKCQT